MPDTQPDPTPNAAPPPESGPIRDDAGKRCGLITVRDLKRAARDERPALRQTADRLRFAMKSELSNMSVGSVLLTLGSAAIVVIGTPLITVVVFLVIEGGAIRVLLTLGVVFTTLVVAVSRLQRLILLRRVRRALAATAVAEGVCGSCAYSLEGAPTVSVNTPRCPRCGPAVVRDNRCTGCHRPIHAASLAPSDCVVCGECGAAWLAARLTRPHWRSPVHVSNRKIWYATLIPGLRPHSALLAPDHRERFVYVPDPRLLRVPRETLESLSTTRAELARHTRHAGWGFRVALAVPFVLLALPVLPMLIGEIGNTHPDPSAIFGWGFSLALLGGVTLLVLLSALGRPPRSTAERLRERGLCGSCLHPLAGLERDASGLVDCPRCGASWKPATTRPTRAAPDAPTPPPEPAPDIPSSHADGHEHAV